MNVELNRQILASKFKASFLTIINSNKFKDFIITYGLGDMYKFEILSEKYRDEAINLCSLRLSQNIPSIITNLSPEQCKVRFTQEIDHAIKTQLSFVAIHCKTSKIAFIYTAFDMLDKPIKHTSKYSVALQKRDEFLAEFFDNNPIYKLLQERKIRNDIKHGQVIYSAFGCSNTPAFNEKKYKISLLTTTCFMLHYLILCGIDCVKQEIATAVHPKSVWVHKASEFMINSSNINLKCKTWQYKINNILREKMESDSWYKQNIDGNKLHDLMKMDYSIGCGAVFFDRDKGVDVRKIMDKVISMMSYIMRLSGMEKDGFKSFISKPKL